MAPPGVKRSPKSRGSPWQLPYSSPCLIAARSSSSVSSSSVLSSSGAEVAPGWYAREAHRWKQTQHRYAARRVLRNVLKAIGIGRKHDGIPPLSPGDVLRDFPFYVESAAEEVVHFSTHPSLCDDVFGLGHGDVVRFHSGANWQGRVATVLGARGGCLWVVIQGEAVARILPVPTNSPSLDREEEVEGKVAVESCIESNALRTFYGLEKIGSCLDVSANRGRSPAQSEGDSAAAAVAFPDDLMRHIQEDAARLYTAEQRSFLQRAPDLFIEILPEGDESSGGEQLFPETESPLASPSRAIDGNPNCLLERNRALQHHVVILCPRVLPSTRTVGWAGEGSVFVEGGGVRHFKASMSASIVV